jgi:hypothetical protein
VNARPRVVMNRAWALLICTRPTDYGTWRVREAAEHLLPQPNVSEEDKRLASAAEPQRRSRRATSKRAQGDGNRMSGMVTLEFLAGQQARILEELANMRADHAVLLAIVQRMDATMSGLLGEVRALHGQLGRIGHRV